MLNWVVFFFLEEREDSFKHRTQAQQTAGTKSTNHTKQAHKWAEIFKKPYPWPKH